MNLAAKDSESLIEENQKLLNIWSVVFKRSGKIYIHRHVIYRLKAQKMCRMIGPIIGRSCIIGAVFCFRFCLYSLRDTAVR